MDWASEILVIILSIFLAIFLILAIVLTAYLISLTRQIRRIAASTEKTVDNFSSFMASALKVLSPMFLADAIASIFKKTKKEDNQKSDDNKQEE